MMQHDGGAILSSDIPQVKEPRQHHKTKHIQRQFHLIRQFIKLCKIHIDANVRDMLRKPLPQPKREAHIRAIGMRCLRM